MTSGRPGAPKITLAPRKVQLSPNVRASPRVTNLRPGTFNAPMATLPAQTSPLTGSPTTNRLHAAPGQTRMTLSGEAGQAPNPTGPTMKTQLRTGGQNVVPVSASTNQQPQQAKVSRAGAVAKPVASVAPMVRTSIPANAPLTVQTSTPNLLSTNAVAQMSHNSAKMKCKNFLSVLIQLASDQPDHVANRMKMLIQALVDDTIQPEEFHNQLHIALNSNPQPVLVPFLEKSLPYLRYSLMVKEFQIEGVRAPPSNAFMLISPDTHIGTHTGMGPHTLTPQVGLQSFGGPRPQITQQLPLITPPGRQLRPNMYESHEPLITPPGYQFGPNLYDSHVPRITAPGQPLRSNHYGTYEPLMMPLGQQLGPNYYGTHESPIMAPDYQFGPNLYESHEPFITPSGQQLRPNLYEYYEPFMPSRFSPYFRQMPLETMYFPPYPQSRPTILTRNSGYNFPNRQSNAPYYI